MPERGGPALRALAFIFLAASGSTSALAGTGTLDLVFTAETRGNLLPCSCPAAALGGLSRRIAWIDSVRTTSSDPVLVVDAGGFLPEGGRYDFLAKQDRQELIDFLEASASAAGYDAAAGGLIGFKSSAWMKANTARIWSSGRLRVGLVAVDDRIDCAAATTAADRLGPRDLTILLCNGDLSLATTAAQMIGAQVAVVARGAFYREPLWREGILMLGAGRDGKYVGRVRLRLDPVAAPVVVDHRLRAMNGTVPEDRGWQTRVEALVLDLEGKSPGTFAVGE